MKTLNNYYWLVLINSRGTILQKVQKEHPFFKTLSIDGEIWCLINYKNITKEEYNLFTENNIANYSYIEPDFKYFIKEIKNEIFG